MSPNEQRLSDMLDRLEAIVQRGERSLWLVDVVVVTLSVTCILFVLMGFLAPLFLMIRTIPGE
jgi:hypothetical protein